MKLENATTLAELKRAYKKQALKLHPEKGGTNAAMQELNALFESLKVTVGSQAEQEVNELRFADRNELHPLAEGNFGDGWPAMKSYATLLQETFCLLDAEPESVSDLLNSNKTVYWQSGGRHICCWTGHGYDRLTLMDVTDGGKTGKTAERITFCVEGQAIVSNAIRGLWVDLKGDSNVRIAVLFDMLVSALKDVDEGCDVHVGHLILKNRGRYGGWTINVSGEGEIKVYYESEKANTVVNPYTLKERYKRLRTVPAKWKASDLVKMLVNGQFYHCKQDFYMTDDYALDAAYGFSKGFHENPLALAVDWIERRTKGKCIYGNETSVSFGMHSNDSSSMRVNIEGTYPAVDLIETPMLN